MIAIAISVRTNEISFGIYELSVSGFFSFSVFLSSWHMLIFVLGQLVVVCVCVCVCVHVVIFLLFSYLIFFFVR